MLKESLNLIEKNQKNCDIIQNNVITTLQDLTKRKIILYKKVFKFNISNIIKYISINNKIYIFHKNYRLLNNI